MTGVVYMSRFFLRSLMLAAFLSTPAMAQGTAEQRSHCTDDAYKFCNAQIPDASAVEACLRGNMKKLSRGCRQEFGRK
jgi:hypothetical protein